MTEKLHKIGEEVAEVPGTSIRTIRYYEEEGLLKPIRTPGGMRLYSARHVDRLRAILALAKNGYSLEAIRALAELSEPQPRVPGGPQHHPAVCRLPQPAGHDGLLEVPGDRSAALHRDAESDLGRGGLGGRLRLHRPPPVPAP